MIKNHNNYLSIPYKVPHFVLSTGEEREWNTGKGMKGWHHIGEKKQMFIIVLKFLGFRTY